MNREIKFRAWDIEKKRLISSEEVNDWRIGGSLQSELFEIMQFTGLKDKNGVEIYEGDVIIDHLINGTNGEYFAVVKCYNYFYPKMIRNGKIYNNIIDPMMFNQHTYRNGVEIIGNIYENPELLEREAE